jgi:hypothetical protein
MMDARLMWTHQSALERRGAVASARLGGHAFPVDDATRVRQRRGRLTKREITVTGADYNQLSTAFSQNGHSQLIWFSGDQVRRSATACLVK